MLSKTNAELIRRLLSRHELRDSSLGNINNILSLRALVLSDPKTASTTVAAALQTAINGRPDLEHVIHMHTNHSCLFRLFPVLAEERLGISELLEFRNATSDAKVDVITILRDPVERGISHFFEDIEFITKRSRDEILKMPPDELQKYLGFHHLIVRHVHWQIQEYFGLNLFNVDFDKNTGVGMIENDHFRLFVGRIDRLEGLERRLVEAGGYAGLSIAQVNTGEEKWYGELYAAFKRDIMLPENLLQLIFWAEEPYLVFAYTESEINEMKERWERVSVPPNPRFRNPPEFFDWREYVRSNPHMIQGPRVRCWLGAHDEQSSRWHYATYSAQRRVIELEAENAELRRKLGAAQ